MGLFPRVAAVRVTVIVALVAALAFTAGSLFVASGQNGDDTFYACLYAGSFSQINTNDYPANCGRGQPVSWEGSGADGIGFQYTVAREGEAVTTAGTAIVIAEAACLDGEWATGGGIRYLQYTNEPVLQIMVSSPALDGNIFVVGQSPNGWEVHARNSGVNSSVEFRARVVCAGFAETPPEP